MTYEKDIPDFALVPAREPEERVRTPIAQGAIYSPVQVTNITERSRTTILLEEDLQPGVTVRSDRTHLAQLLSILLDNAVKYTEPEGRIGVALGQQGDQVILRVENGPARLTGDPSRLFERFYRGDPARTQKTGGSGIGLSAARAIAETWQGTIRAETKGEDRVVFTVTLPAGS